MNKRNHTHTHKSIKVFLKIKGEKICTYDLISSVFNNHYGCEILFDTVTELIITFKIFN